MGTGRDTGKGAALGAAVAAGGLVGAATGMRSQLGLVFVLNRPGRDRLPAFFRRTAVRRGAVVAALGELVADKLPATPSRLDPAPWAARVVLGGLAGGLLASRRRRPVVPAAVAAMASAAIVTRLSHDGRAAAAAHVADPVAAVVEDGAAVSLAWCATRI